MNRRKLLLTMMGHNQGPRTAIWVQQTGYDTKAETDALVAFCVSGRVTDIFALATDFNTTPFTTMGESTLGHVTAITVEGVTPLEYLIATARTYGVRVHIWVIVYTWAYWGGATSQLLSAMTNDDIHHATGGGGNTLNFAHAEPRGEAVAFYADMLAQNPGLAGINLDYIRTDGVVTGITAENVATFVSEMKAAIDAHYLLSSTLVGTLAAVTTYKQDPNLILAAGVDLICIMAYYTAWIYRKEVIDTITLTGGKQIMIGIGTEAAVANPSDVGFQLLAYYNRGFRNFAYFDHRTIVGVTAMESVLIAFKNAMLTDTQGAITETSTIPGTSFTNVVGGVEQTTAEADVAAFTNMKTLKAAVEAALGSTNPAMYFYRPTTSTVAICVGDYAP